MRENNPPLSPDTYARHQELVKLFRYQLGTKQFPELENTWLDLIEENTPLEELIHLVDLTIKWGSPDIGVTLLRVLATSLSEKGLYEEELNVLRRLVELTPADGKLASDISICLRNIYKDEPLLERIIQKAGIGFGIPLKEALERFDILISLTPGKIIYDQELGLGRVKDLDLLFDRVTIKFDNSPIPQKEITIDVFAARKRFSFPQKNGFFYLLVQNKDVLLKRMKEDPTDVILAFLKDLNIPQTSAEIQKVFEPLLGKEGYRRFWEGVRKGLTRHPHIKIQIKSNRPAYLWVEEPQDKEKSEEFRSKKERTESTLDFLTMESGEIIRWFKSLRSSLSRKNFLRELAINRPEDWMEIYRQLFFLDIDSSTRNTIAKTLIERKPEVWGDLLEKVNTEYRSYPDAFLFLVETIYLPWSYQTLSRVLDLIELNPSGPIRNRAKKLLIKDRYQIICESLKNIEANEAARLLQRIKRTGILEKFQEDEIETIVNSLDKSKKQSELSDIIWSSPQGIEKARLELKRLIDEELPRVAEEIGRARAFGDLSENYEYKSAREKQARLIEKIARLQKELAHTQVIQPESIDTSKVTIGCKVKLMDSTGEVYEYTILGPWDSNIEKRTISFQSPLAGELLNKKVGDEVTIGKKKFIISEITPGL